MKLLIGAILLVGIAAALVWLLKGPRSARPAPAPPPAAAPITTSSSPEDRFWAIVESSARHAPASDAQTTALRNALEALPVGEVESFERIFQENMGRSYSWDLWGAGYVING